MLSLEEVRAIARLARIELAEADAAAMRGQLNAILAMIEEMRQVDTSAVQPMAHPQEAHQRLREDRVTEADERERFQALAPQVEDGLYLVPRVVD
jgi:aspartyl-tRNA(Asn)/glutamyl-tRNA(Gln) amidotransferase subunit C